MTASVDFTSQDFFRDPAAGIARLRAHRPGHRDQVSDHRQGLDHDDPGADRARAQGQRDLHAAQGGRRASPGCAGGCRRSLRAIANNMLTMDEPDHTRLREHRRRSVPPPRHPRHGAAHPRHRRRARRRAVRGRQPGRPRRRATRGCCRSRSSASCSACRQADRPKFIAWANSVARLTNAVGFLRMIFGLMAMRALSGGAPAARPRARRRRADRRARAGRKGRRAHQRRARWCRWCSCCSAPARRPRRI